jgi:ABC-type lipoprotein export system ATPase subunit
MILTPQHVSAASVVVAHNIWKSYDRGRITVLQGVDLSVRQGETVALCGASGSGKSTLLNILGGLDSPDHGEVLVEGKPVRTADERTALLRHTVGFVFQLHNLIGDLTLMENCLVPALAAGRRPADVRDRIMHLLEATGIVHRARRPVQELSGGERQRAAVCRALVNQPHIVLADEPTGSLDLENGRKVFDVLLELVAREQVTLVLATHDRELAESCQRLVLVRDGRLMHDV